MEYEDELDRMRAQRRRENGGKRPADNRRTRTYSEAGDGRNPRAEYGRNSKTEYDRNPRTEYDRNPGTEYAGRPDGVHQKLREERMRKKKKKKRLLIAELIILVFLAAGAYLIFGKGTSQKGYWTIAVFGVDARDGNLGKGALSDVEMLCNIDKATGEIKLVSVYRDTYLKINSEGTFHKINEAYFKGGHTQAVEALNENLDLKIDDYATFNWKSVAEAINILGGIDLEITDSEFAYINSFITETVNSTGIGSYQLKSAGMNHLDGVQAVAYARLRLMDTDFNRTERQRKVVMLALEKAKQADFGTLKTLVSAVFPQISTSIGIDDLFTIAKGISKYHIGETAGFPFSRTTMRIGKMDCVIATTLESNVVQLHQYLYQDENYSPSASVKAISARISEESGIYEPGKNAPAGGGSKSKNSGGSSSAPKETAPPETEASAEESTEAVTEVSTEATEPETTEEETETATKEDGSLIGPGAGLNGPQETSSASKETAEGSKETKEETKEAETKAPGTKGPETKATESKTPQTKAPETEKTPDGPGPSAAASQESSKGPGEIGPGVN